MLTSLNEMLMESIKEIKEMRASKEPSIR